MKNKKSTVEKDDIYNEFKHLVFNPKAPEEVIEKHLLGIKKGLLYSMKCLKGPSDSYLKTRQVTIVSNESSHEFI